LGVVVVVVVVVILIVIDCESSIAFATFSSSRLAGARLPSPAEAVPRTRCREAQWKDHGVVKTETSLRVHS
jgi:hypothetical protein